MKLVNFYRKPISIFVMVTFTILLCFWANQAPAAPAAEKNAETTMEQGDSGSPDFIEAESESKTALKKPKKFPWLLVGAVVVVGAAALYFLVLKKTKYELTVNLGAGTTGTPATAKYKKGEVVPYSFSAQTGYADLQVMLDGAEVAAEGNVTMDKDHTITTSAVQGAIIHVNSTPSGASIYMDNVDSGFTTPHSFIFPTAVTKAVVVRGSCGYKDFSQTVSANVGDTITVDATLGAGIKEDFNIPASSCWAPHYPSNWKTVGGNYRYYGNANNWSMNAYKYSFSPNYTVTVKMNRKKGLLSYANGLWLLTSTNMTDANGYGFWYWSNDGDYYVVRAGDFNFINSTGKLKKLKYHSSTCVIRGSNKFNIVKVVKSGSNYTFYINNVKVHAFNDPTHDVRYCVLGSACFHAETEMLYDYVYLDAGSTAGSVPGLPVKDDPAMENENVSADLLSGKGKD